MQPRDVVLTPTWNWHDHGKKGADQEGGDDNPVIWLDGLDLPFHQFLPTHFNEHYADSRYPAVDAPVSPIVFPWVDMQKKLDTQPGPYATARYTKSDGREGKSTVPDFPRTMMLTWKSIVSRTIGAGAERIDAHSSSPLVHETSSSVYHVVEGSGYSVIEGEKIPWKAGDTFVIPAWHKNQHFADGERVYLYHFDDKPALKSIGTYRVAGQSDESLASAW
jgi:gentisate 1,2-dioxygenase